MVKSDLEMQEEEEPGLPGVRVHIKPVGAEEPGAVRLAFEIAFDQRDAKARDEALRKMAKVIKVLVPPQERGEFVNAFKAAAVLAMATR